jgi:anti-anti-sigma regulatory factor
VDRAAADKCGAEYLIIDVTGLKDVDMTVASRLVQAARGLDLLGTRAIITGIRPEVAQTLVGLRIPLDTLVTKAPCKPAWSTR